MPVSYMRAGTEPIPPDLDKDDWLHRFLIGAAERNLCTGIGCTTCGATEFRAGLSEATKTAMRQGQVVGEASRALAVARALARVNPVDELARRQEAAVRFVLFDLWTGIREEVVKQDLEPVLIGTWAGEILSRMKLQHENRLEARRRHDEANDPLRIEQRREDKRRKKQVKHAERLAAKKERDRLWRETQRRPNS